MIKAIITGSTGMVGEGVLFECLNAPEVKAVLVVNRKSCGYKHPKLKEIIHTDFTDISSIAEDLKGYNACYFCLGVTSLGKKEEEYSRLTFDLTLNFCSIVAEKNEGITICYVSGAGTDSTGNGKIMWARIKGKTENAIIALPGVNGYGFRPGIIKPTKGLKYTQSTYKYFMWVFPLIRIISPKGYCTLREIGLSMIEITAHPRAQHYVEVKDIILLAAQNRPV